MRLPHIAPIGALRTQAGVKRSETPVKSSRQQNREDTTEILSPQSGLQSARTSFAGVPLRYTTCLCSVAPIGACNLLVHPLQEFRYTPPPACNPNAPIGACNNNQNKYDASGYVIPL